MNLEGYTPAPLDVKSLPIEDRWILSRLATRATAVTKALEAYHFAEVAADRLRLRVERVLRLVHRDDQGRGGRDPVVPARARGVLDGIMRLIHPMMPFVSGVALGSPERGGPEPGHYEDRTSRGTRVHRRVARVPGLADGPEHGDRHRPDAGTRPRHPRDAEPVSDRKGERGRGREVLGRGREGTHGPRPVRHVARPTRPVRVRPGGDEAEAGRGRSWPRSSRRTWPWPG